MRFLTFLAAALLIAVVPAANAVAQGGDAAARGNVRTEIERILNADNLGGSDLTPREVVETITAIPRGGAPEDFWQAYQVHVDAWRQYADLADAAQNQRLESAFAEGAEALAEAEEAVNSSFGEVERIARRYGARLPSPPVDLRSVA